MALLSSTSLFTVMGHESLGRFISNAWVSVDTKIARLCDAFHLIASHVKVSRHMGVHIILGTSLSSYDSALGTTLLGCHKCLMVHPVPRSVPESVAFMYIDILKCHFFVQQSVICNLLNSVYTCTKWIADIPHLYKTFKMNQFYFIAIFITL